MTIATPPNVPPKRKKPVYYPTSDGKPMAETDKHVNLILYCKSALMVRYADNPDVYISGNNFVFYEEGSPGKRVSPDGYVVFGVPMRPRDSYKAWEEGDRLPSVVFEFTSKSTRKEDVETKRPLYENVLRVPEYFQFDPTGDYLKPRLQGLRLNAEGRYEAIPLVNGRLYSEQLNLELVSEGETLRFFDPETNRFLPDAVEMAREIEVQERLAQEQLQRAETEFRRAEAERARADKAEAELAALRALQAVLPPQKEQS